MRKELGLPLVFSHKEEKSYKSKPVLIDHDVESNGSGAPVNVRIHCKDSDEEDDEEENQNEDDF